MNTETRLSCTDCGAPLVEDERRESADELTITYHCSDCNETGEATWLKNTYGPSIPDGEPRTTGCVPSPIDSGAGE